jgi:hypothetical protein
MSNPIQGFTEGRKDNKESWERASEKKKRNLDYEIALLRT